MLRSGGDMLTADLAIETLEGLTESRISVTGSLAVESSTGFRSLLLKAIRRGRTPVIVIDMSGISALDTSGVATLLEAVRIARAQSVRLRVMGLSGLPRMLAEITELDR